jgi:hypothetical protein
VIFLEGFVENGEKSMTMMKFTGAIFAGLYFAFTLLIFGSAYSAPDRLGLLPAVSYWVTYPISEAIDWAAYILRSRLVERNNLQTMILISGLLYLVIGTAWFYFIGLVVGWSVNRMRNVFGQSTNHGL